MKRSALLLSLLLALPAVAAPEDASHTWQRLVGLLQYLASDYPAAVESGSSFELTEQRSFLAEAAAAAEEL
ncbi:MAG: cytochrome C, partial [Myxococcaceae bacterium]